MSRNLSRPIDSGLLGSKKIQNSGLLGSTDFSGRVPARAEDARGTPAQSHISPSILSLRRKQVAAFVETGSPNRHDDIVDSDQ